MLRLQQVDRFAHVVAHQVDERAQKRLAAVLLRECPVAWMDGDLRGRQREDQPATANVNSLELQHVAKERAIRIRIGAVQQNVRAEDHRGISSQARLITKSRRVRSACFYVPS